MTAPVWLRLTGTHGRGTLVCVEDVIAVRDDSDGVRQVECVRDGVLRIHSVTDTLDDIAAALGVGVPAPAAPAPLSDADEAVAMLRACGWAEAEAEAEARHDDGDGSRVYVAGLRIGYTNVWAADDATRWPRNGRTLAECARVVIRDAVERGIAPDMDAARALVASWGGA